MPKLIPSIYDVGRRELMQLSQSEIAGLIEELVRRARQGDDKSVFGLLLLLERETDAGGGCGVKVSIRENEDS